MIIGITGKARHGKDTIADYLVENYEFKKVAFANNVKKIANEIFGFDRVDAEHKELNQLCAFSKVDVLYAFYPFIKNLKDCHDLFYRLLNILEDILYIYAYAGDKIMVEISPRKAYQIIGTELFREYDPDFWVKNLPLRGWEVVSDVRFGNEAEYIKLKGGIIIKVVNPRLESNDTHISEAGIAESWIDWEVINDGSIYELQRKIDQAMKDEPWKYTGRE